LRQHFTTPIWKEKTTARGEAIEGKFGERVKGKENKRGNAKSKRDGDGKTVLQNDFILTVKRLQARGAEEKNLQGEKKGEKQNENSHDAQSLGL